MQESLASVAQAHQHEISVKEAEIETLRKSWQSELDILYARETEKNESIMTLESEIQSLKEDLETRGASDIAGKDPREDFQSELITRIYSLDRRVRAQETWLGFRERRGGLQSRDWSLTNQDINRAMNDIGFELESILLGHNTETSLLASRPISNSDLASLVDSYLSLIDAQLPIQEFLATCDVPHLISTLTVVAMRDWVFHTDFPNFIDQKASFVQSMRKYIMAFGQSFFCEID
jgi:hypothetical protein